MKRIGLICDIHEDFQSLNEVLRQLESRNCDEVICLGDIIGYDASCYSHESTRNVSACISAIKSNCRYAVIGNHDLFALKKIPQSTAAFNFPPDWYQLTLEERRILAGNKVWLYETESPNTILTAGDRHYLESLPEHLILRINNHSVFFSHALHPDLTGSLLLRPHNPWELKEHLQLLAENECSFGFSGHLHPNGILIGSESHLSKSSFGIHEMAPRFAQYICPSIANGLSSGGYTIMDFSGMTIEAVKNRNHKTGWKSIYERLVKKSRRKEIPD